MGDLVEAIRSIERNIDPLIANRERNFASSLRLWRVPRLASYRI